MNILNSRSLISLCLFFTLGILPTLSQYKASASLGLADNCLPPINRSVAVGADAMQFKRQPLRFEINRGQTDLQARFIARASDSTLFLTANEAVLHLPKLAPQSEAKPAARKARKATFEEISMPTESAVIRLRPVNSNAQPRLTGMEKLPGVSNYFIGNDPRKWRTEVEAFAKVKYENLYPGIDLIYYGNDAGEIEYDFKVAAGANSELIAMSVEGAEKLEIDEPSGDLILSTTVGRVRQHAPLIYQEVNGKRQEIAGRYRLIDGEKKIRHPQSAIRNQEVVAFELGEYDESKPLVIDPVVVYSTLLGGAAGNFDGARDVAVDAEGNAYIVGVAESSDFPTRNPFDGAPPQRFASKAFIAKFAPDGSLIYSTFLGSTDGSSSADAIAVDGTGAIYVAGSANPGFPIVNAFQPTAGSFSDAFLTKMNAAGTMIIYSSFLGGNQGENLRDLKLDAQNNVYLLGEIPGRGVASVTFPTVNPTQASYGGGDRDMFLSIVAANGTSLLFSTFFGGNGDEEASSFAVSSTGNLVTVAGASNSTNLAASEIVTQADDPSCDELKALLAIFFNEGTMRGHIDIVVPLQYAQIVKNLRDNLRRDPTCTEILHEIYTEDSPIYNPFPNTTIPMGQLTGSGSYPPGGSGLVTPSSLTPQAGGGGFDVFIAPIDQNGNGSAKGIFGGSRDEFAAAVTKDSRGAVYITGDTNSTDLPTVNPTQATPGGANDNGFVVVFAPDTFDVLFATYLGGDGFTLPQSIAVDAQGNIFVSGTVTIGTTFPTTPGAFQRDLKGRNDAFLVKYSPVDIPTGPDFSLSFAQPSINTSFGKVKVTANISRTGGFTGNVTITPATPLPKGIILVGGSVSTTDSSIGFKLKVKGSAERGAHQLSFQAKDDSGKTRTATLTLTVQ
ncbi:MAG: SBBP repeat-containing protein [Acidobacteria bacterium]|nr:SBBP repeat-containing protein [Acidobacteriota bacterium]